MSHVIVRIIARYAPIVTLPVAIVIGAIGYNIEKLFPRKPQVTFKSVHEEREERLLQELTTNEKQDRTHQSKNVLDRNQASDLKN